MPAYWEEGFVVRQPAWHGLAEVLPEFPGREAAMAKAGHAFEYVERPLWSAPVGYGETGEVELGSENDWKAIKHSITGDTIHIAKKSYTPIQPVKLWDVIDAMVDQPNVRYESAGVLAGGAVLWCLAWLDEPVTINGDNSPTYPFVSTILQNDGNGAMTAQSHEMRIVCWNTAQAALLEGKRNGRQYTFRHTANVDDRIEDAKMTLKGVRLDHADFIELANELAKIKISPNGVDYFVNQFIPMPPEALISDRVVGNVEQARQVVRNVLAGPTINQERATRNAYDLMQAGVEYLDHLRVAKTIETRFRRQLIRPEGLKSKLLPLIKEAATL